MSPWFNATCPSYCHEVTLSEGTRMLKDKYNLEELKKEYPQSYNEKIYEIAKEEYWAVKTPVEYAPTKMAFRGGRTEIVALYAKLSVAEIEAGVEMRAADICSSYPSQQIKQRFPVGLPDILIWNLEYRPCRAKKCVNSLTRTWCRCPDRMRGTNDNEFEIETIQPTARDILDQDWNGYVCVDIQPCKMMHPIIPYFDEKMQKCIFSCQRLVKCWVDTPTLKTALKAGYILEKVHSFFRYRMADSLWADSTMRRVVGKVINSESEPEDLEAFAQQYEDKFGEEFGDRFRATRGKWGFNPALRQVMKIAANCGWGKHAQKIIQKNAELLHPDNDVVREEAIVTNIEEGTYKLKSIDTVGPDARIFEYEKKEDEINPNLHNVALDAAAFVPAYGRLQLWRELDLLEKDNPGGTPRVMNMDTDSIYYKWYPDGVYNIPEGTLLGDWSRDDDREKGGIVEFVGLGPKTYSYKCKNGWTSPPKTKGVRLGYSTEKIVNFYSFKQMALAQLGFCRANETARPKKKAKHLMVPQTGFVSMKGRMVTLRNMKKLGVDIDAMKRELREDGYMYPYGYDEAPERVELAGDWDELIF